MPTLYTTKENETLDWICWKYYRATPGATEVALVANPKISATLQLLEEDNSLDVLSQPQEMTQSLKGVVEAVLNANPGLCDRGVQLPAGIEINLPEIGDSVRQQAVPQLWD